MTDYTVGETLYFLFTTRAFATVWDGATGIPTVLAGTPVISAYEDNSATQITAGITLGVDHDSVVGLNLITVVATGGNGFEAGKQYGLVITTGTVGGVSVVGQIVKEFSLEAAAAFTRLGAPTGASVSADVAAVKSETALIVADTNELQTDDVPGLIATLDAVVDTVKADTAAILVDTADMQPKLGTPAADLAADVAAVKVDTAAVLVDTGTTIPATLTALLTTAMTEAYPTDGATMSVAEALYLIAQSIGEFAVSGTTITVKKIDGSTSAATYTLNDGTNPTSRTRAT